MTGKEVKNIRKQLEMTQRELAKKFDVNIRTVQYWEADYSSVSKSTEFMLNSLLDSKLKNKINNK